MSEVSRQDLEKILQVIDKALAMHMQWHEDLIRNIICKLPLPDSVIKVDAHQHCDFGCWFYHQNNAHLRELPSFQEMGNLHQAMHASAREICLKITATGLVTENDYDHFIRNLARFRDCLRDLQDRSRKTLANLADS